MSDKLSKVIRYLMLPLLCAAVIVCYFPTLTSAFHLDDFEIVLNNNLTDAPVLPLIKKYPTRWLVFFSYWLNLRPAVTGFFARFCSPEEAPLCSLHSFNLLIHIFNSWLIYLISLPLFLPLRLRGRLDKAPLSCHLCAAFSALFFALIPLQSQSVIYIGQRFTLLSSFFYLLMLYFVTRAYFGHLNKALAITLAVVTLVIGLFCKEILVTAPISCLVLLWLFEASPGLKYLQSHQKKNLLVIAAGALVLLLVLPVLIFCQLNQWNPELIMKSLQGVGGTGHVDINVEGMSRLTYFLTQPFVMLFYVALFFCPGLLSVDHDIPLCTSFFSWQWFVPVMILLLCCYVFFKVRHKYPLLSFGFFFFIFPLLPQSSLVPTLDLAFEHRMYLSVAGLIWMFADLLRILCRELPKAFVYFVGVGVPAALLLYAVATYERGGVWKSELTLWADAIKKAPSKQRVVVNFYSAYLSETGDHDTVINALTENLPKWHKVHPRSFALLGSAYQLAGNMEYAVNNYVSAIDCDRTNPVMRYNAAILYLDTGKPEKAVHQLNRLIEFNPDYADGYYLRGIVNRVLNRKKQAVKDFEKYIQLAPHGENLEEAQKQLKELGETENKP
ncbi:tetratricopeptide repeat protein [bacterium]|nr:tetratricopeptide repeat protein [bacterium]